MLSVNSRGNVWLIVGSKKEMLKQHFSQREIGSHYKLKIDRRGHLDSRQLAIEVCAIHILNVFVVFERFKMYRKSHTIYPAKPG